MPKDRYRKAPDRDHYTSNHRSDRHETNGSQELDEGVIEVQVIPQDDDWGETATTITETATSIVTLSEGDISEVGKEKRRFDCRHLKLIPLAFFSLLLIASPILFIVIPIVLWKPNKCGIECDGMFLSLAVKEFILIVGIWALYFRKTRVSMPRVNVLRVGVMVLVFIVLACYWLFYGLRIIRNKEADFSEILKFAGTLLDSLLFLHYLSVVVLWLRHSEPIYTLKVIRSTDGVSKFYSVGALSIQRAAIFVLEKYYKDFPEYNPYMMTLPARTATKQFSTLKFYDIDGKVTDNSKVNPRTRAIITSSSQGRRNPGRNDRFYEEAEYERKVKRRKARLMAVCEEAFGHIRRIQLDRGPTVPMDPEEAAQSLFPSFARPLQKYLRTVKQHHRHNMDAILKHLAHCLAFDMSPKAFLERYMCEQPCVEYVSSRDTQEWSLVCEEQVTSGLSSSTVFQLKTEILSLVVTVKELPYFDLSEEEFDFENNKFVLKLNSETSV
ncbi:vang-like protein 2 [Exaiptasia diaphana]|uniref:Vang-like protein n=1 Tax=Exaiptasia diaphana TaxID=2652724 RepID=A0A913XKW7_EXADI|nr:vang-like protein 2 [Exaiptasia diaphana]KXJ25688.1 Vang-like protein 1 [Exaiptasia diaphana]